MSFSFRSMSLVLLAFSAACGPSSSNDAAVTSDTAAPPATARGASTDSMQGMAGMPGMAGRSEMAGMSGDTSMQAHMRMMGRAGADSMQAMLPMHRQMVANMLSRMSGEMRQMNMPTDAAWNSTIDSLRQDLVRLPELTGVQLRTAMPSHMDRVTRLSEMHQRMMRSRPR